MKLSEQEKPTKTPQTVYKIKESTGKQETIWAGKAHKNTTNSLQN